MIGKNNPLNIRTSSHYNWNGQIGATRGFCDFAGIEMCRRAGAYLLMRSYRRAKVFTLEQVINRWAPTCENPTNAYIEYVSRCTQLSPAQKLCSSSDFASVLAAMEIFEQGIALEKRSQYYATARASYLYIINLYHILPYEN